MSDSDNGNTPETTQEQDPPKTGIVEAVGVATGYGASGNATLAHIITEAMSAAVADAQSRGITDPDEIRKEMMAARQQVLDSYQEHIESVSQDASAPKPVTPEA